MAHRPNETDTFVFQFCPGGFDIIHQEAHDRCVEESAFGKLWPFRRIAQAPDSTGTFERSSVIE
jgi:hypothetical protein